jgi:hypothetical protein
MEHAEYESCIRACLLCAAACDHCAAACLGEKQVERMTLCIRLDMECAAACYAAARLMSLGSERSKEWCRICAAICEECGTECNQHEHEHCRECAKQCFQCAEICRKMAA